MKASSASTPERKSKTKRIVSIMLAIVLVFVVASIIITVIVAASMLKKQKKMIAEYDGYANIIGDYSFILGCQNTVKCQITESSDYSRKYVYNTYLNGEDNVIFQYGLGVRTFF